MSPRKVGVLIKQLPPGAALWRAMGSDAFWGPEAHLMAAAVDALNGANWQRGAGKGPHPKPVQRPADIHAAEQAASRHEQRALRFLARQKVRGEKP